MPTLQQSVALMVLFKQSFGQLWPDLNHEYEANADWNIRKLMASLEKEVIASGRKQTRANVHKTSWHRDLAECDKRKVDIVKSSSRTMCWQESEVPAYSVGQKGG